MQGVGESDAVVAEAGLNEPGTVMLVPRGSCTFERKALSAQRLGASAIAIHGSLQSRYILNTTEPLGPNATDAERKRERTDEAEGRKCWGRECTIDDVLWPGDRYDYDCSYGRAMVPTSVLSFNPLPYNGYENDPRLSGTAAEGNLCAINAADDSGTEGGGSVGGGEDSFADRCESSRCLLTGKRGTGPDGGTTMEACCAWDLHIWLYDDPMLSDPTADVVKFEPVKIPAFYVTIAQGDDLLASVASAASSPSSGGQGVSAVMYSRYKPEYNPSALIIWAMGVFVAALAAWISASEYRDEGRRVAVLREVRAEIAAVADRGGAVPGGRGLPRRRSRSPTKKGDDREDAFDEEGGDAQPGGAAVAPYHRHQSAMSEESMELNIYHAFGFIITSSCSLLVLFYFKIYSFVKVMYAFGCSGALTQALFHPLYSRIASRLRIRGWADRILWNCSNLDDVGPLSNLDVASIITGYSVGLAWLIVAFTQNHPDTITFFWVCQDVMGACMCIMFLSVIKLNSIRVASILLIVAFFYDIFFVFVTPLLTSGGESIMINVATSGGPPKADPSWCEKYPRDVDCQGGDPLPMLLTMPRIGDYQGGASLLGLGDIVLPGLLLSFAARFDEAKRLIGIVGGGSGVGRSNTCPQNGRGSSFLGCCSPLCNGGYFVPVVIAYAVGLFMANAAVYIMQLGQPALLYLVPCCLGTMCLLGWSRGEMMELWHGPRVVRAADRIVYGDEPGGGGEAFAGKADADGGADYVAVNDQASEAEDGAPAPPAQESGGDGERVELALT